VAGPPSGRRVGRVAGVLVEMKKKKVIRSRDTFTEAQGHAYLAMLIRKYNVKPLTLPTYMGKPSPVGYWVFTYEEEINEP